MTVLVAQDSVDEFVELVLQRVEAFAATRGSAPGVDVLDGGVLRTPKRPYMSVTVQTPKSSEQRYSDSVPLDWWPVTVLVVNDNPRGALYLAGELVAHIDDQRPELRTLRGDGLYMIHDYDSGLITDDEVEGDFRHSVTCYFEARREPTP